MKKNLLISLLLILGYNSFAQAPTDQDCGGAIAVCQNVYTQANSYSGTGNYPTEINSGNSCLGGAGEVNSVWYTFTTQTAGNVCFTISPNNSGDDYDWAVYDLTNNNCSDIYNNAALEVSCNFSGVSGDTGPNGNAGAQNEACIPVGAGETYVVAVQNWSGSTNGYTLDFGASSATIFDNVPPSIQSVNTPIPCGATTLTFDFTENILCNTITAGDFTLTGPGGPYTVTGVTGANCAAGGSQENTFTLSITPGITTAGAYQLCLTNGSGSVTDLCGNTAPAGCLNFNVTNTIVAEAGNNVTTCENAAGNVIPVGIGGSPTGSGGTGPYTYSWTPTGGLDNSNAANPNASPSATTVYTVVVTDNLGCSATDNVTVTINNLNPPNMASTDESCAGANDGTATATPTNGTPNYTYSWNTTPVQNTNPATGLAPGNYTVTVTDANGCGATNNITINPGIVVNAGFTPPLNQCLTGNSFTFNNTGSAGGGVTYNWDFGDASGTSNAQNPTYSYGSAGTYTVTQIVSNGPCADTVTANITVYDMPVPTAFADSVDCFGGNDGSATVNTPIGPGPGPFGFSWNTTPVQTTNPASNLTAGTYTVTVTDQTTNCTGQATVTVFEPPVLSATENHVDPSCNGFSDGTATANPSGGTPGYSYSWNTAPVQNTQTATGLSAGTYTCTITDANGCQTTVNATLIDPPGMVLDPSMTQANCGQPDGSATVNVIAGGTGPYTYSWNTTPVQNTQTASNIAAGTYTVTVTDQATGCTEDTVITVTSTTGITATATLINDALCNGSADGSAYAAPTGGTAPYTYSWNTTPVQTNDTLIAGAGTYTVTITDDNGCTGTDQVTINEPTLVNASISGSNDVTCFGFADGDATAQGAGGTPGYSYSWNTTPVQNTQNATGLAPGTYTVTVADTNGCTDTASVTIIDGPILTSSIVATDVTCFGGNNGSADLTINGATAPYTYNWTPSGSPAEDPTGLTAGTHYVTVTSQEGCTINDTIVINEPPALIAVIDSSNDVTCFGLTDGVAYSSASGGTTPYTYSWNTAPVQNTQNATNLGFGAYTVTVTDSNGCTATANVNINQPPALAATTGSIDAYCGLDQGSVWVNPTNGTAPYIYTWDSSATVIGNTDTVNGLYPGSYNIVLEDANGCKFNASVNVNAAPGGTASISASTNVSCNGGNDGTATVSVGGAFPGYTYLWDAAAANQTTNPATGLSAGNYSVTVTDTLGCIMTTNVNITEPTPLNVNLNGSNPKCPDSCNAFITAVPSGGSPNYTYSWNTTPVQIGASATNLCDGTYSVTVTDSLGCTVTDSLNLVNPPTMTLNLSSTPANCNQADGGVAVSVATNGTPPFTYQWNDGTGIVGNTDTVNNLPAGTYMATVTDSNGCSVQDTVTISNLSGPSLAVDSVYNVQCFGGNDGYAEVQITGGTFPYTYNWNSTPVQTTPSASNLPAGNYVVTVTDSNGCVVSTGINITEPTQLQLTAGGVDPSCFTYTDGTAWVNAIGGTTPYAYSWNTTPVQNNDSISGLGAGTYVATVTDTNGCFDTVSVTLVDPLLFSVNVTGNNVSCNAACDGTAITTLTNGIFPFTYAWDDPSSQSTDSVFGLCADTFNVVVTDGMGCVANGSVIITEPAVLIMTENTHGDVSCNGGNDGFSSVNVVGGTGPYNYVWDLSGNTVSTNQSANNLVAGSYLVTVTDTNGCTDQINVVINEPNPLDASATTTDVDCFGASTGEAVVSATGGTAPYAYQWDDAGLQQTDTAFSLIANTAPGYSVTVTDSLGCTFVINNIVINEPTQLVLNTTTVSSTCGSNNGSATVNVGGGTPGYSYSWNTTPTQGTATASNIIAGNYVVTVTDNNGCVDSTTANVTDLGSPTVTIPTSTDVSCNGAADGTAQSNVVGGTAPYTYSWNTTPVQTTPNATGLSGQTYSVTVTDSNGCIASASVTIVENSGLNAVINASTNVSCNGLSDGDAAVIGGGGGAPYTFSWNTGNPADTLANVSGLAAGSYIATVTDTNGCTATDTILITEPNPLAITLDSLSDVLCNAGSDGFINIDVAGGTQGYSYAWAPNVSNGATAAGVVAGNYTVYVTDANNCLDSATYTVNEPNQLVVDTVTVPSTCGQLNGSATVNIVTNSTPGYTYSWNDPSNQTTATANGLAASNYVVTVTDANGCSVTQNVTITDLPGPIIDSVVTTAALCNGQNNGTATVYASGNAPFNYLWDDPFTQTTQQATGLSASPPIYTVVVTDVNGCTSSAVAQIAEPGPLSAVINAPDTVCYGQEIQLFANANQGTQPYLYSWIAGYTGTGQGPHLDTLITSTSYTVEVQDINGCSAAANKVVYVRAKPQFLVNDATICLGDVATLTPYNITGGNPNNPFTFWWMEIDSITGGLSPTGVPNPTNPLNVSPADTTDYIVWVDDGCSETDTLGVTVNVNDTATGQLLPVLTVCHETSQEFALTTVNGVTFGWDFDSDGTIDQTNSSTNGFDTTNYVYSSAGNYNVTVHLTTATGCTSVISENGWAIVNPNPTADFTTDPSPSIVTLLNPTFDFIDLSFDASTWDWNFDDGNFEVIQNPTHTYADTGYYDVQLIVSNTFGCSDSIIKTVRVKPDFFFAIPNTFTPNGDGLNEFFHPGSIVGAVEGDYSFYIFNRWGELIFEGHDLTDGWDGTYKGKVVPTGTYVWRIEVKDQEGTFHNYNGHVNVLK